MSSIPGFMTIMNIREMGKCSYGTWVHEGCVLIQLDKNVTYCPICLKKIKHITSCINISIASYTY